jgi:hypothetical protein
MILDLSSLWSYKSKITTARATARSTDQNLLVVVCLTCLAAMILDPLSRAGRASKITTEVGHSRRSIDDPGLSSLWGP